MAIAPARKGVIIKASPQLFKQGLLGRPVMKGDIVSLGGVQRRRTATSGNPFFEEMFHVLDESLMGFGFSDLKFIVVSTAPLKMPVIISDSTEVEFNPEAVEVREEAALEVSYEDIGGLREELNKIREMVELPLKHPEVFERLGIEPPKGVLLHGHPGTGKTLLAKAVASETSSNFLLINGPEIMCVGPDTLIFTNPKGCVKARDIFEKAREKGSIRKEWDSEVVELREPVKTYAYHQGKIVKGSITHATKLKAPAYDIALSDGNTITVSANQPFLVHRRSRLVWKRLEELKTGEFVAKVNELPQKDTTKACFSKPGTEQKDDTIRWLRIADVKNVGEKELYDFTVDKDSFVTQNLLLLHNSKYYGQSEENLRKKFEDAEKNAPSIIFIDEIDAIASKREETRGEVERRVVAQLLSLMDGLQARGKVIVLAATNRPNALDPALRRPGRFDREIEIGVPSQAGRLDIIKIHTRNMPLAKSVDLKAIAAITHGFVGADLSALAKEAAMVVLRRVLPDLKLDEEQPIPKDVLEKMNVTMKDFKEALKIVRPSAMREVLVEVPDIGWGDIGSLDDVRRELIEAVEWPLKYPKAFQRMGIRPPRGILLYGAPGTGKTLLGKAIAHESESNFILVNGPSMLSKWVGESEKAVREIFRKARQTAPTIIFFDEIDSLAPRRGMSSDSHVTERVVNQILTEMDGLEELHDVVVIAATNRPDIVDTALLRPGRFDRIIMVPVPDAKARKQIFAVHLRGMPLAGDVNVDELAQQANGYVGADIEAVCREAAMLALREDMEAKTVAKKHFTDALEKVRASVTEEIEEMYEEIQDTIKQARAKEMEEDKKPRYVG